VRSDVSICLGLFFYGDIVSDSLFFVFQRLTPFQILRDGDDIELIRLRRHTACTSSVLQVSTYCTSDYNFCNSHC
jgi:hypothetical protein